MELVELFDVIVPPYESCIKRSIGPLQWKPHDYYAMCVCLVNSRDACFSFQHANDANADNTLSERLYLTNAMVGISL